MSLGVTQSTDLWLTGKIKIVNAICIMTSGMIIAVIIADLLSNSTHLLAKILGVHALIMLTPFYLNYKQKYIASRVFFLTSSYIGICLLAVMFGQELYFQYYLVPGVGMSLIFFRDEIGNKKWLFTFAAIPLWVLLELWFSFYSPLFPLQQEHIIRLSYLSSFLIFITVIIMFGVFTYEADTNLKRIRKMNEELEAMAKYDALTGLPNRHFLNRQLEHFFNMAQSQDQFFAFCIVDIDFFKKVNDNYGHEAGDNVLKIFAKLLKQHFRKVDLLGRMGGEEFCIAFYGEQQDVTKALERFRKNVEQEEIIYGQNKIVITASLGVAYYHDQLNSVLELYKNADDALYQAKNQGRNRICQYKSLS